MTDEPMSSGEPNGHQSNRKKVPRGAQGRGRRGRHRGRRGSRHGARMGQTDREDPRRAKSQPETTVSAGDPSRISPTAETPSGESATITTTALTAASDKPLFGARTLDRRTLRAPAVVGAFLIIEFGIWCASYAYIFRVETSLLWQQLLIWILPLYVLAERRFLTWSPSSGWLRAVRRRLALHWKTVAAALLLIFQVVAVVAVPIPTATENDSSVAWLWIFLGLFQVRVAISLTKNHLTQVRDDLNNYLSPRHWLTPDDARCPKYESRVERLRATSSRRSSESGERPPEIEAEAQSQIQLLLRLYHGIVTAGYVVLAYFLVGERFDIENFIYQNNEGFTAALTLLIVVIATVAIQMYQDVTRQIRVSNENFERDVSLLSLSLLGVEHRIGRVWSHAIEYLPTVYQMAREEFGKYEAGLQGDQIRHIQVSLGLRDQAGPLRSEHGWAQLNRWFSDDITPGEQVTRGHSDDGFSAILQSQQDSRFWQLKLPHPFRFHLEFMQRLQESVESSESDENRDHQTFSQRLEQSCKAMTLKASRYVVDADLTKTISACDSLDVDASYFLDDQQVFKLLLDSADSVDVGLRGSPQKKDVRKGFAEKLRYAEYARLVYIGGWLWYVKQQATNDVESEVISWLSDGVRSVVSGEIADVTNQTPDTKNVYFAKCLESTESALHNLRRAALARQRRQRFAEFERLLDNFVATEHLSIPIIPRYRDRVRHLQALFNMSEENQALVRMLSIHSVLTPEPAESEKDANANRLWNDGIIPFPYGIAGHLVEAHRFWKVFIKELALPTTMNIFPMDVHNMRKPFRRERDELTREQERIERFVILWYAKYQCCGSNALNQPLTIFRPQRISALYRLWRVISNVEKPNQDVVSRITFGSNFNRRYALEMLDFAVPGIQAEVLNGTKDVGDETPESRITKVIESLMKKENENLLADLLVGLHEDNLERRNAAVQNWRNSHYSDGPDGQTVGDISALDN